MNYFYTLIILLISVTTSNLAFSNDKPNTLDKILVIVNNDIITQSDFNNKAIELKQQLTAQRIPLPDKKTFNENLLQNIIEEKLQLQLIKKMNITVTPKEINNTIEKITQSNQITLPQLKAQLQQSNLNFIDFKKNIEKQLLLQRLQQSQLQNAWKVSPQDIQARMIQLKKQDQLLNTQYELQHLLLVFPDKMTAKDKQRYDAQANKMTRDLTQHPEHFSSYGKKEKSDFTIRSTNLGLRKLNDIPSLFKQVTPSLKLNGVKTNIKDKNGVHFIKLIKKTYQAPSEDNLKQIAMQQLSMKQGENELKHWIVALKKNAFIKIIDKP